MPEKGTVTELAFDVLDQRNCCKQDMHVQNNWHEDEEEEEAADRNFPRKMDPVGPICGAQIKEKSGAS